MPNLVEILSFPRKQINIQHFFLCKERFLLLPSLFVFNVVDHILLPAAAAAAAAIVDNFSVSMLVSLLCVAAADAL